MPVIFAAEYNFRLKQFYLIFLIVIIFFNGSKAQLPDTVLLATDSIALNVSKPLLTPQENLLAENKYLNSKGIPESLAVRTKKNIFQEPVFYLLAGFILFFGIIRTIYARYFSTLFRVFFNSSLRQSQLTDQLLQSKLPSLFFNIIFLIAAALYVYFLLQRFKSVENNINWVLLASCIAAFFIIYIVKFLTLKFMGWVTGYLEEANTYIFVVFLINKIIGICLLPVIVLVAFSAVVIVKWVVIISFLLIGLLLLLRFFRSYGLLQHKLNVSRFHFLLYIFSLEILPLMVLYKAMGFFIAKNL
jgi:hypothetical protein